MQNWNFKMEMFDSFIDSARNLFSLNPYTQEVYIIKLKGKYVENGESIATSLFLNDILTDGSIYEEDRWQFSIFEDMEELLYQYKEVREGITLIFRRKDRGKLIWHKLDLSIPADHSEEKPLIHIYGRDLDKQTALVFDSISRYTALLHKITMVDVADQTVTIIQEPYSEHMKDRSVWKRDYAEEIKYISENFIYQDDKKRFLDLMSVDNIKRVFSEGHSSYSYYFRRRLGIMHHWIKVRITPVKANSWNNTTYYLYAEDVHREFLKLLDYQNVRTLPESQRGKLMQNSSGYYENMLLVLHDLTQPYVDFYMILLEQDLYIQYKFQSETLHKVIPVIGSYSQMSREYIEEHCEGMQAEILKQYCTSDKLRELMRDRLTQEYEFYDDDGRKLRTICQKIESVNGTPTKLLCRTVVCNDKQKLRVKTFGNFEVFDQDGSLIRFTRNQSKQLLAYLIDRQGYPVTSKDIVADVLDKPEDDMNAIKYCSTLIRKAMKDLEEAGYPDVIIKEKKSIRVNTEAIDCDYYHLLNGERSYLLQYHNEYMKEYSWAESTNAEILSMVEL